MTMAALSPTSRRPRFIAGGPDEDDTPDDAPARARYACAANNCPMPGTMFPSGSNKGGVCHYHYAANPSDWPRISKVLNDWRVITSEVNEARRVLCDQDLCCDIKAQNDAFRGAWERLQPALVGSGWHDSELAPAQGERYGGWANRLEAFMGGQVLEALRHKVGSHA